MLSHDGRGGRNGQGNCNQKRFHNRVCPSWKLGRKDLHVVKSWLNAMHSFVISNYIFSVIQNGDDVLMGESNGT
jgi:hypothetical protein